MFLTTPQTMTMQELAKRPSRKGGAYLTRKVSIGKLVPYGSMMLVRVLQLGMLLPFLPAVGLAWLAYWIATPTNDATVANSLSNTPFASIASDSQE